MIKTITVTNHLGESLSLSLKEPEKSGFIIEEVDGLGPVKAEVNFTEMATVDGDNSARIETRNINLSLIFLEHPTIEDTRLLSYKYFPNKRNVTITIETDKRICETVGRVEDNDPSIFEEKEGCEVSILCPDPFFYSKNTYETIFYGVQPLFEFPFENASIEEPLIEFGEIRQYTEGDVYYDGDIEVGVTIKIHAIGPAKDITIYDLNSRETILIEDEKLREIIPEGIVAGDDIIITTMAGKKGVDLIRSGISTNILSSLGKYITWFTISKGDNLFAYRAVEGLENLQFSIQYKMAYEGV